MSFSSKNKNIPQTSLDNVTYLGQTDKYIHKIGGSKSREYSTTSSLDEPIPSFQKFVGDDAYREALSGKVIHCVDILVMDRDANEVLLGRRDQEPHSGDWVIGGSMRAGETFAEAAARNVKRELHIDIDEAQLSSIGNYSFVWDSRAQASTINEQGEEVVSCHMSSTLELYPVDKEDIDLSSYNEEYDEIKWVNVFDIISAPAGTYHPCLVDMVNDTLEKETTPEKPRSATEAIQRHIGAIAYHK